ncbi:MAG: MATE family efflux transporter [Planctomycetota bacterium]
MPPPSDDTAAQAPRKRDLTSGSLLGTLLRLAVPVAADSAIRSLYNLADAFWLGRWSKEGLAAAGVTMPFFFVIIAFSMGFGNAGTAAVSQFTGADDYRRADRAAAQTLLLMFLLAATLAVPLILFAPSLFALVQVPEAARPHATSYIRILSFGLPLIAFNIAYGSVLRGLGDTVTPLLIGAANNVVNVVLDPFLIFGWGVFPELGAAGAALAGLISLGVGALGCYIGMRRKVAGLDVEPSDFRPDTGLLRRIFRVGIPAALNNSSTSVGFALLQVMVNTLGTAVIGAFTIGFRIIFFFGIPAQALAAAAAPVVGQALGAGKPSLARRAVWRSALVVGVTMFVPAALLMLKGELVAAAFTDNQAVIRQARRFLLIMPAASYFFSVLMVLTAAFYGSGHTKPAMFVGIMRTFVFRLPLAYVLAFLVGWGSYGIYAGWAFANVASALLTLYLFLRGGWETAAARE